ncbi:hypothetical protein [Polyangium fumosum]|uniref:Uncharacterized protein n=1 Tax=Polyangium fumosum TaxID=889272 RepID=A0A4U1IP80_9BACT|nr:hypothetical protein [Polyangium fumosum]TKC95781.1 hypothetical protein E8A74_46545 [Polyangium fumosum]
MQRTARFPVLFPLVVMLACVASCKKSDPPPPQQDPPKAAASVAPSASAASAQPAGPKAVPTLVLEEFAPAGGSKPEAVFDVEGAIVVTHKQRVGRIAGDGVEWLKETIPPEIGGPQATVIDSVQGRWPDAIDVLYRSDSMRAPVPSYMPLTGKGTRKSFALGGGPAALNGIARIGESVLLLGWSYAYGDGIFFSTVRGPKLDRKQQMPTEAGCKPGEVEPSEFMPIRPAIWADTIAASKSGVLVAVGQMCHTRGPALEVWDADATKSRFIDVRPLVKDIGWWPKLLGGKDEVWLYAGKNNPILQLKGGELTALPRTAAPPTLAFVSTSGVLHVVAGPSLERWEGGQWVEVGKLSWPMIFRTMVVDGDAMWASAEGKVYRVREGKGWSFAEGCKTPLVYLYDVKPGNANNFTFPGTRKALATFPGVADIRLVEFSEGGRRLGVEVKNQAQGEALISHVKATMQDENPILICHAPEKPRVIEIKDGK